MLLKAGNQVARQCSGLERWMPLLPIHVLELNVDIGSKESAPKCTYQSRILPQIRAIVPIRLVGQLIDVEVDVAIEPDVRGVGPNDPRIPNIRLRLQRCGVVDVNRVLLRHEHVHGPITVGAEPVSVPASLAKIHNIVGCPLRA